MRRWRIVRSGLIGLTVALAVTAGPLTPASAASDDLDAGLVFFGQGYAEPTRYVDGFNALAGRTATAISASQDHACAVDTLGEAVCWGREDHGRLGSGTRGTNYSAPALVRLDAVGNPALDSIDAGGTHTCALSRFGRAFCWGSAGLGRLGDGRSRGTAYVPVRVATSHLPSGLRWTALTTGKTHTCALDQDGRPFCWGDGSAGQLGTSATRNFARPHPVATGDISGRRLVAIEAGGSHTCAVDAGGRVYCWGSGAFGQLGMGDTRDRLVPRLLPGTGPDGNRFVDVSAGIDHTCAVSTLDQVFCWGSNAQRQVSSSTLGSILLPDLVEEITAVSVSAGSLRTCAVEQSGATWCWGTNGFGQIGDGTHNPARQPTAVLSDGVLAGKTLTTVQTGRWDTVAIDSLGQVYGWGALANSDEPVSIVGTPNELAGTALGSVDGAQYGLCVTDADDRILCPNSEFLGFAEVNVSGVGGTLDTETLSVGNQSYCVLDVVGAAYCWGWNLDGELGIGPRDKRFFSRPQPVVTTGALDGVALVQISVGGGHTCAIDDAGKAYCWGLGRDGVLGTGTTNKSNVPVAVETDGALHGVTLTSIETGIDHTCAASDDARLFCWGKQPGRGSLLEPAEVNVSALRRSEDIASMAAGQGLTCLLTDVGRAYCWGKNALGQVGSGSDADLVLRPTAVHSSGVLDGVRLTQLAISSDWSTTVCGLSAAGRVFCWGSGRNGMLGNGGYRDSNVPVRVIRTGALTDRRLLDITATYYGMWLVTEPV